MSQRRNTEQLLQYLLFLLFVFYLWWAMSSKNLRPLYNSNGRLIFILAGQSNMAGRGGVNNKMWDGVVPQECFPNPAIRRLSAGLSWEVAHEPLHADIDYNKTCGVGPGLVFAKTLLQRDSSIQAIGLVPCAVGGTSISEWSRGTKLYDDLVMRASAAVEDGGIIQAILWYQGERDTITWEEAKSYKSNFEKLIGDLRNDLRSPKLPIFQVVLASAQGPFMEELREAQLAISLPNVICIDAKGLPLQPDGLHLSTAAQVLLGEMLTDAFLRFRTT